MHRPLLSVRLFAVFLWVTGGLFAPAAAGGASIKGSVADPANHRGIEYATIALKEKATGATVRVAVTDASGAFELENVPPGKYRLIYGALGAESVEAPGVIVGAQHRAINLGPLPLAISVVTMEKIEVTAKQVTMLNALDRKIYNVGKEIQTVTGTASDLLQNIPSVQVDLDGNVSLRGADNVMILVNGRSSALMGRSRAEALQQLPADSIEKIEVITNPSAKFKPDGTAGIINISLKRTHALGYSALLNLNAGNQSRTNVSVSGNYDPGKYHVFGSYSLRLDDRELLVSDRRTVIDPVTGAAETLEKSSVDRSRPLTHLGRAGIDLTIDDRNKAGVSGSFNHRTLVKHATDDNLVRDGAGNVTRDFDRTRYDPERDDTLEFSAT